MTATFIFPHQLFLNHPGLHKEHLIVLVEHPLFFGTDKTYPLPALHIQKKILHRASMLWYKGELEKKGYTVLHVQHEQFYDTKRGMRAQMAAHKIDHLVVADPVDDVLEQRIKKEGLRPITWLDSPGFYLTQQEVEEYQPKNFFHKHFYEMMRKKYNILLNKDGSPKGGKWSFDADNRKKMPESVDIPPLVERTDNEYVVEAKKQLTKGFGSAAPFLYPTTRREALAAMRHFFEEKFSSFGDYQDAIDPHIHFGFHSVLSSSINIGLLTPDEVVEQAIEHANEHDIPMNSLEGFVRQILGWREFIRVLYRKKGRYQRTHNEFGHTKNLTDAWYDGTTGIDPLDDMIQKTKRQSYAHHIERLMIAGNLMTLARIDPDEAYCWFMELFIDAYDWVMVPNVYGMALFADGGLMTTKPYISSSNYIRKMSHYKKGAWSDIWDDLYWHFVSDHQRVFTNNPRTRMMVSHLKKMDKTKLDEKKNRAQEWIEKYTG